MAQTTVDWLIEKFKELEADFKYSIIDYETYKSKQMSLLEQANKMFEQQIKDSFEMGQINVYENHNIDSDDYFNLNFKSEQQVKLKNRQMIKIKDFFLEESKFNKGLMVMVAVDENAKKWVVSGDHHAPTYLVEYEKSSDTKESNLKSE